MYGVWGEVSTQPQHIAPVLCEKSSVEEGKRVGEKGETGGSVGERQEGREKRSGVSPGELQTAVT